METEEAEMVMLGADGAEIAVADSVELLSADQNHLYGGEPDVDGRLKVDQGQGQGHLNLRPDPQQLTWRVIMASLVAAIGGVLFGYDVGIVSAALLQLKVDFQLSCMEQTLIVSTMLGGAVVGALVGGFILDRFGRRDALIFNAVLFIIGGLILALTGSIPVLLLGRVLVGFAVALSAVAECIYISELSPANRRGRLVSLNELAITLGFLLAYLVGYLFINVKNGWRYMFGLSSVPAVLQGAFLLFLPKSPRFLMLRQQEKEAYSVLCSLRGSRHVDSEMRSIKTAIQVEKSHSAFNLLSKSDNMRGRMFIGVGLIVFQQFTGQPNVLYFAPTIFQSLGFRTDSAATLATVGLGAIKVLSTSLALIFVDRIGRRHFLLTGIGLMTLSIFILGISTLALGPVDYTKDVCDELNNTNIQLQRQNRDILSADSAHYLERDTREIVASEKFGRFTRDIRDSNQTIRTTQSPGVVLTATSLVAKWLAFICLMLYVLAYAFSFGPGTWLILSEIFPASVRGRAISLATILNWSSSLLVSMTFLQLLDAVGVSLVFLLYAAISGLAVLFTFFFVPETKNKSLEQISTDLSRGSLINRMIANLRSCCKPNTNVYLTLSTDDKTRDDVT